MSQAVTSSHVVALCLMVLASISAPPIAHVVEGADITGATREEIAEALTAAFGRAGVTISTDILTNGVAGPPATSVFPSGTKYNLVIDWDHPVASWTEEEKQSAKDRAHEVLPRMMATVDGTRWRCEIPIPERMVGRSAKASVDGSNGKQPFSESDSPRQPQFADSSPRASQAEDLEKLSIAGRKMLQPLHGVCLRKPDGWWTYEVCIGKHIRQYHAERQADPNGDEGSYINVEVSEFILGKFDDESQATAIPPSLFQQYGGGTHCDLTGELRRSKLEFLCQPDGKYNSYIEAVNEIATCEYHVKVRTPLLCKNPSFIDVSSIKQEVQQTNAKDIKCTPFEHVDEGHNIFLSDSGRVFSEDFQDLDSNSDSDSDSDEATAEDTVSLLSAVQQLLSSANEDDDE